MKKYKKRCLTVFLMLYLAFTVLCGCSGWILPAHRMVILRVWYRVSAAVWLFLAAAAAVLLIRLLK